MADMQSSGEAPNAGKRKRQEPEETEASPPKIRVVRVLQEPCHVYLICENRRCHVLMRMVEDSDGEMVWEVQDDGTDQWVAVEPDDRRRRSG